MKSTDTMTLQETCVYLGMDETAIIQLAAERRIPSTKVDGEWMFSRKSIDKWRAAQERRVT